MARFLDDPSSAWLRGIEHAVFDPRDWAGETLREAMVRSASRDRASTPKYGQLIAINQQFRLLLIYMKQWEPTPSVITAFQTLYELTRGMAQELKLNVQDMDNYLLDVAIQGGNEWSLNLVVPRNHDRLNQRDEIGGKPGGWPLTQATADHRFDSLRHLIAHGARWDEQGKKVLTELACDLPDHPAVDTPHRDRDLPWWAPLYNDERAWQVLTRDVVKEEFLARHGNDLALARDRLDQEGSGWVLDLIVNWSLVTNRNAEQYRDTVLDAVDHPDHRLPSRETLLAELFLSRVKMTPQAWAFLEEHDLTPTPVEQEAIMVLRVRLDRSLSDLPSTWLPTVHQGKALWALLDASAWSPDKDCWNDAGRLVMAHADALQALADQVEEHPAGRWLNGRLHQMDAVSVYVPSVVKEREDRIRSTLQPVLDGLARLEARFTGPAIDRAPIHRRLQRWVEKNLMKDADTPRAVEERELRRVDLDAWLTTWANDAPAPDRTPRSRTRL